MKIKRGSITQHTARAALCVLCIVLTAGCVNLSAVRDFAGEAKSLSAYSGIPADLVSTNVRRQALYGRSETPDDLEAYKSHKERFENQQTALTKYMGALAAVADDGVVDFKKEISGAAGAASKAGILDKADADLFSGALNLLAKIATDTARQKLLKKMVSECDPSVQKLTAALAETIENDYLAHLVDEQRAADSLLGDAKAEKSPGLFRLAYFTLRSNAAEIEARKKSAVAYAAALRKIAEGHARLRSNIGKFTTKELIAQMKSYQNELKELREQLK